MSAAGPGTGAFPLVAHTDRVAILDLSGDKHLGAHSIPRWAATVEMLRARTDLSVVVLRGGREWFNAGAARDTLLVADSGERVTRYVFEVPRRVLEIPQLTVAAMEGHAVGGGLLLGLWCDVAWLAAERLYGANFTALGFTPAMGATAVLAESFGEPFARRMMFDGRLRTGRELPLSDRTSPAVLPAAEVLPAALAWAVTAAEVPIPTTWSLKATLAFRRRRALEAVVPEETAMHDALLSRPDIRAFIADSY
ncbi:MAG: enoyl-CoA hydratase-related protein [Myxococcota bacterium]